MALSLKDVIEFEYLLLTIFTKDGHWTRPARDSEVIFRDQPAARPCWARRPFTPAELQKVLEHIDGDLHAIAWQLALTGLRRGGVAGLRWSDVDLDARTLQISSTQLRFGKHLVEDTPKSRAGRRTLPIPVHLAAALRTARAIQAADRLALSTSSSSSSDMRTPVARCGQRDVLERLGFGFDHCDSASYTHVRCVRSENSTDGRMRDNIGITPDLFRRARYQVNIWWVSRF